MTDREPETAGVSQSMPNVAAIIPCYNRTRYLREAIDSALGQTYPSIEIIAVDDGSTDSTSSVLASYGDAIRVIRQENAGTAAARNTGIAASTAPFLAWLDSDDRWRPEKIAAQVQVMRAFPQAAVVYTACRMVDAAGNPLQCRQEQAPPLDLPISLDNCGGREVRAGIRVDVLRMLVVESQVMPSSCLVRRGALDEAGPFDPNYRFSEDWELNFRLARRFPYAYVDAPLTDYRVHADSKSQDRRPHALGRLELRHAIEAARAEIRKADPSREMRRAYHRHTLKFADAYYRVGKLALADGDAARARECLRAAIGRNPRVMKYYPGAIRAILAASVDRSPFSWRGERFRTPGA
ncbi:MAG: glycosyltransferase [Capsulimonadaceae bacterium]